MNHRITSRATIWAGTLGACVGLALAASPAAMKAIVQTGTGGPEVLGLQTVPVLEPREGQVLIRVYAASVNPVDWKMRRGGMASSTRIPGMDVAGVIEKLGPGVTTLKVGEPVFSMIGRTVQGLNGSYAQFSVAPADNVVAKPKNLSYAEAAGLGVGGMTGARLVARVSLAKGQRVLITGVAGGVGSAAAQLAKARGAYVIGTASARHNAFLKSIGIDEIVDYTQGPFEDKVRDVDAVMDTVGGDTATRSLKTLKKGGTFSTVVGRVDPALCAAATVTCVAGGGPPGPGNAPPPNEASEGELLRQVGALAAAGKFVVHVDREFPLERAADAQEFNREGHTQGKVILVVDPAHAHDK